MFPGSYTPEAVLDPITGLTQIGLGKDVQNTILPSRELWLPEYLQLLPPGPSYSRVRHHVSACTLVLQLHLLSFLAVSERLLPPRLCEDEGLDVRSFASGDSSAWAGGSSRQGGLAWTEAETLCRSVFAPGLRLSVCSF